jgi:hypothetical protein
VLYIAAETYEQAGTLCEYDDYELYMTGIHGLTLSVDEAARCRTTVPRTVTMSMTNAVIKSGAAREAQSA